MGPSLSGFGHAAKEDQYGVSMGCCKCRDVKPNARKEELNVRVLAKVMVIMCTRQCHFKIFITFNRYYLALQIHPKNVFRLLSWLNVIYHVTITK